MSTPSAHPGQPPSVTRKRCFDPVVDHHTRVLVLGSLPGEQSLALQQYYANRQNKFWALMSDVLGVDLVVLDYAARLQSLLRHGVGLWDVVAEAHRKGSLDSNIRERNDNDLCGLLLRYPNIQAIAFNGGTAGRHGLKVLGELAAAYDIIALPSSSPAHTMAYAVKAMRWRALRPVLADVPCNHLSSHEKQGIET
ncbi:DNA-deoxyinosine glycosylase [Rugamonas apoptosis]|uniref:DNA-deoxyinosine glycosylase n=1 Tax=Rugamonas apoptosis TaxID=2758570 RepID=A0A7W2IL43_9BURK|nr:DNA-deoxyinosine glycosylase [Rugamonas apoptosis]MBA5688233.1 DNA-deoxyinosine glycosylase [Rugamonas apoptosis]